MAVRIEPRSIVTKRAATRLFARHGSAYVISSALLAALAARARLGRPRRHDLVTVAVLLIVRPFFEWTLHRYVLHGAPRVVGDRAVDPGGSHRGHHDDPDDVAGALMDTRYAIANTTTLGSAVGGVAAITTIGMSWMARLHVITTAMAGAFAALLTYEWTHLLFHTAYRPRTARVRRLRANHQRHHHRDDTRWFGVTTSFADRLLGTGDQRARWPAAATVAASAS